LRDEVVNLVVAGAEAPGTSLAWLFHELSIHPDVEERVAAEVSGALQGRRLGIDDLANLPFTAAVVKETLRLHTPTWFLSRHTLDPTTLGGYHLPEDAEIAFSLTLLHRHSAHYDDPAAFDPERWLDGRTDDLPQSAYLPFGAGKHGCLGESFTQQVMTVATATIVQRWRLVRTGPAPTEVPVALVQAKGLHLRAEPRQGASAATLPTPS
jgi:cytochrome P450